MYGGIIAQVHAGGFRSVPWATPGGRYDEWASGKRYEPGMDRMTVDIDLTVALFDNLQDTVDFLLRGQRRGAVDAEPGVTSKRGLGFLRWVAKRLPEAEAQARRRLHEIFPALKDTEVRIFLQGCPTDERRAYAYRWLGRRGYEYDMGTKCWEKGL